MDRVSGGQGQGDAAAAGLAAPPEAGGVLESVRVAGGGALRLYLAPGHSFRYDLCDCHLGRQRLLIRPTVQHDPA